MAYQLSDIVTKVQQRVRDTGYSSAEIKTYINDTQNDVFNEYQLRFMQDSIDYATVLNTPDITNAVGLPDNYVQAIDLTLLNAASRKFIPYINYVELDALYANPGDTTVHPSNVPTYWYMFDNTINLFPAPNAVYNVRLKYYKKPTELVDDADVPEIPSEFQELLVTGAAYRVLQVKDNYDQASILQNRYDEILQKLVKKYSQIQTGTASRMRINRYAVRKPNY